MPGNECRNLERIQALCGHAPADLVAEPDGDIDDDGTIRFAYRAPDGERAEFSVNSLDDNPLWTLRCSDGRTRRWTQEEYQKDDGQPVATSSTPAPTAPTSSTTRPPRPTSTEAPTTTIVAPRGADPAEVARQVAVVYFTYGVDADGYPSWDEIIAPEARPTVRSQLIGADYANAECVRIVREVEVEPSGPSRFQVMLNLAYVNCARPPTYIVDGSPLPTEVWEAADVLVGPSPTGGLWGTEIHLVDLD